LEQTQLIRFQNLGWYGHTAADSKRNETGFEKAVLDLRFSLKSGNWGIGNFCTPSLSARPYAKLPIIGVPSMLF
jgi:hypothetical protein